MTQYVLKNKKVIDFFDKHSHLDFNEMNGVFVDIMDQLIQNMSDTIENSHNTALIKTLAQRMENMETSFIRHQADMSKSVDTLSSHFSNMISKHLDSMMEHMRETIKSNNGDTEKSILERMTMSNELFLNKITEITHNESMRKYLEDELKKINTKVQEESERVLSTVSKEGNNDSIEKLSDVMTSQYKELDAAFKARIDSFFTSQSSTNGSMYTEIMNRLEKTTSAVDTVGHYFQKQIGSTNKGKQGEAKMEVLLATIFPNAEIKNTSGMTAAGDFIVERKNGSKILLDTKDYDTVVPIKEVDKLIRDVEKNNCHGILLSQNSGIAQKEDFEINVHNHKIIIFVHLAKYDKVRIQMAFSIIDHLEPYLSNKEEEHEEIISNEVLTLINKEYQELVTQKLNLIQSIRKSQGDLILQVQKLDLPALTKYLDKKFANTGKTGLQCDICNVFIGKNPKSLAAHKRRCVPANKVIETMLAN